MRKSLTLLSVVLMAASCGNESDPKRPRDGADTLDSERVLLEVSQPYANHNGGALFFGTDGYLYLGLGDGGGGGDNDDNAQDRTNLLGTIVRVAVNATSDTAPFYTIPPDNPFVGNADGWREEIFAYGLRNPWRVSVDPVTGTIWAGDVGQNAWEEVDIIVSGGNYGWDCREGKHVYTGPPDSPSPECAATKAFVDPVWEYGHASGISITGGYVYRGPTLPGLVGKYVYADYGSGRVWALAVNGVIANVELTDAAFAISSFGVGEDGELFILEYSTAGKIYRVEDAGGGVYQLVPAFPALAFDRPVDLRHAGDGSGRLFVVEQEGRVVAFDTADPDSSWTYFDISGSVSCCGEMGLLGLAFHPDFAANGYAYIYYTASAGGTLVGRLSRVQVE